MRRSHGISSQIVDRFHAWCRANTFVDFFTLLASNHNEWTHIGLWNSRTDSSREVVNETLHYTQSLTQPRLGALSCSVVELSAYSFQMVHVEVSKSPAAASEDVDGPQ